MVNYFHVSDRVTLIYPRVSPNTRGKATPMHGFNFKSLFDLFLVPRKSATPACEPEVEETRTCNDSDSVFSDEDFDEEAYLLGKIPILRSSVDRVLPPRDGMTFYPQ